MRSLTYQSGTGNTTIDLYCDALRIGQIPKLRSRAWNYTMGYRALSAVSRPAREATMDATSRDAAKLDEASIVFDADMQLKTPGKLVINDEWSQRCYMSASEPQLVIPTIQQVTLTTVLLDGVWRKPNTTSYTPSTSRKSDDLDLPTDMPFDLALMAVAALADNPGGVPAPIQIRVFGPATNPYITIGGNRYQVDCTVPDGGYLTVDGVEKTIILTDPNGDTINLFSKGHRGDGEGKGEYIFERIPAGSSTVAWQNSFGFDLTVYSERSVPPWSTL